MPKYILRCVNCDNISERYLSISQFLSLKKNIVKCNECEGGRLEQRIKAANGRIDKDKDTIVAEAKEEAREIIERINSGDEKAFIDVYGDRVNPLKQ